MNAVLNEIVKVMENDENADEREAEKKSKNTTDGNDKIYWRFHSSSKVALYNEWGMLKNIYKVISGGRDYMIW